jgi:hypothetical protein
MGEARGQCAGCRGSLAGPRCDWCGAAVAPGGLVVEKVIAQGTHGRVYRARNPEGSEALALKELQFASAASAEQIDAFEREARMLQAIEHPAVPRFVRSFREGQGVHLRLYLASELIEGESLGARVARAPLSTVEALAVARQLFEVLLFLHRREPKVIHRDVKPDNLILRPDGSLVLVDFGSARSLENERTHRSTLVGTFGYMPPEQLGGTVDVTSDLYAAGATLLHAVTGKTPSELLDPELGLKVPSRVDARLRPLITKLTRRNPAERFQSAKEVLDALNGKAPVKRSPLAMAALGAAVVLAVLGFVGFTGGPPPASLVAVRPPDAPAPTGPRGWFSRAKPSCNPVEVAQWMARSPPPPGWEGQGFGAGCYALAGKIEPARRLLFGLQGDDRWRGAGIVFDLAHGVADRGDDVAAAPIMDLVLEVWPNHFQALYHAGMSAFALGEPVKAKAQLTRFLELYSPEDFFRQQAIAALKRIEQGLGPEVPSPGAH